MQSAPMRHQVVVRVHAPAAVIVERVPPSIRVEPIDENTCAVHAGGGTIEMLALYLGMMDADFTVTEPPELVERVRKLGERFTGAAPAPAA